MATTNAQIDISVNGLEKLDKLQTGLNAVTAKFNGLKTLVAGLGLAALGKGILQMADELDDLSQVTGIATTNLLEFKKALELSGGKADQMPTMLQRFSIAIDEAAQGSIDAQNKFLDLKLSLEKFSNLSLGDQLLATLEAIGKIEEPTRRAALMMDFFGKTARTVNPGEMAQKYRELRGSLNEYSGSLGDAKRLNEELTKATDTLKLILLQTFAPAIKLVVDWSESLKKNKDVLNDIVSVLKGIAAAVAFAFAFTAVGGAVRIIGSIGRGVGSLVGLFTNVGTTISTVFGANSTVMKILRGVGGLVAGITASLLTVLGLKGPEEKTPQGQQADVRRIDNEAAAQAEAEAKAKQDQADADEKQAQWDMRQRKSAIANVRSITSEYQKQRGLTIERMDLETKLIGMSEDEKQRAIAKFELEKDNNNIIEETIKKRDNLGQKEQWLVGYYNEQIAKLKENKKVSQEQLDAAISRQQVQVALEKERQLVIEQINKALERQAVFGDQLVSANDKLKQIEFEGKIEGLNDVQKQIERINEEARLGALQAGRAIAATYEGLDLSAEQSAELARRLEEVQKRYKAIADTQINNLQQSRTFASGWKKAFNEYVDSAKNASEQARNFFNKTLQGMEDLIVNFAKTGKFEWKSFVASMMEELLRSQIRQTFSNIMQGMQNSMGGGIMDTISSLLGFGGGSASTKGQSANNPLYVLDISGGGGQGAGGGVFGGQGAGGGIFSGISNVFSGITNTISNIGSTIGNVFSGVSSSIGDLISGGGIGGGSGGGFFDSIASGIGDLFDGWFAGGGNIRPGKFGIVGENGPEFVGGPASVTPMSGGGSVTYNINAVDAASFKALVAADPGFIHAVAMAGAGTIPSRR